MEKLKAILLGAGDRGAFAYGMYGLEHPNEIEFIAVADPDKVRRDRFAEEHKIIEDHRYEDWKEILIKPQFADVIVICTQDRMHFEPTIASLKKGYHVLLEKPMSPNLEECIRMTAIAEENERLLSICHVLRYSPFWSTIKTHIDRGDIGDIASIQLSENVGYLHMAHSFVRGNWRNSELSSPMLLQKSCHDMDIIEWLMDSDCQYVSSYGSLQLFCEENAPEGSTEYCLDGCAVADECPFYAPHYYLNNPEWAKKITNDVSREGIIEALKNGPYGKCVFHNDNNVVDHQVVNLRFQNGETATFSMCGLTHDKNRTVKIMGTKGDIVGDMASNQFTITDFLTGNSNQVTVSTSSSGHGGSDSELVKHFIKEVHHFKQTRNTGLTSARESLKSHMIVFAAEQSRLNHGESITLDQFHN
jgi:predicted dehydrogenase